MIRKNIVEFNKIEISTIEKINKKIAWMNQKINLLLCLRARKPKHKTEATLKQIQQDFKNAPGAPLISSGPYASGFWCWEASITPNLSFPSQEARWGSYSSMWLHLWVNEKKHKFGFHIQDE